MGIAQSNSAAGFGYEIGAFVAPAEPGRTLWALHSSESALSHESSGSLTNLAGSLTGSNSKTKKKEYSIFVGEGPKMAPGQSEVALASDPRVVLLKNGFRAWKRLRHPNLLQYIDGKEMDGSFYVVTESVVPLQSFLKTSASANSQQQQENYMAWGFYQIIKAVQFLNESGLLHCNITTSSIFVNKAGDWKLGGFELLSDMKDSDPPIKHANAIDKKYKSPEWSTANWSLIQSNIPRSVDVWLVGILIHEIFYNSRIAKAEDLKDFSEIPGELVPVYQQMLASNPQKRISAAEMLESKYFGNNFIKSLLFLENITIKDQEERENFFKKLDSVVEQFPTNICKYKILPQLIQSLDYGTGSSRVIGPILKIGKSLSEEEYQLTVNPSLIKWFASPDPSVRANLLKNLESFIDHLKPTMINDHIYPNIEAGFSDQNAGMRELTLRSMIHLVPKMNDNLINNSVLKHLMKMQGDPVDGIRTNTVICLRNLAANIPQSTRKKAMLTAFTRGLRDPFSPCRVASSQAFKATVEYWDAGECSKLMGILAPSTVEPDRAVRSNCIATMKDLLNKLQKFSDDMRDESVPQQAGAKTGPDGGTPGDQSSGMWSWATSAISNKYYGGATPQSPPPTPTKQTPTPTLSAPASQPSAVSASSRPPANSSAPAASASAPPKGLSLSKTQPAVQPAAQPAKSGWDDDDFNIPEAPKQTYQSNAPKQSGWDDDFDDQPWEDWNATTSAQPTSAPTSFAAPKATIPTQPAPKATIPQPTFDGPKAPAPSAKGGWDDDFGDEDWDFSATKTSSKFDPKQKKTGGKGA